MAVPLPPAHRASDSRQSDRGADRRREARIQLAVEVDFGSAHNFYGGKTRDISTGGLFIDTGAGLPVGTIVSVDLRFLKTKARVEAEVMWSLLDDKGESVGLGVRFLRLPDEIRQRIETFMGLRPAIDFMMMDAEPVPLPESTRREAPDLIAEPPPQPELASHRGPPPLPAK